MVNGLADAAKFEYVNNTRPGIARSYWDAFGIGLTMAVIAIILGSGLGDFAGSVDVKKSVLTTELPSYPPSTIAGHEGKIHFAEYEDKKLLLFQGRFPA